MDSPYPKSNCICLLSQPWPGFGWEEGHEEKWQGVEQANKILLSATLSLSPLGKLSPDGCILLPAKSNFQKCAMKTTNCSLDVNNTLQMNCTGEPIDGPCWQGQSTKPQESPTSPTCCFVGVRGPSSQPAPFVSGLPVLPCLSHAPWLSGSAL